MGANERFHVAWLSSEDHAYYLGEVRRLAAAHKESLTLPPQIVFEGNAPAHLENNELLAQLMQAQDWPQGGPRRHAWFGEPVAIKDPTTAIIRRQSGANVLMAGQNLEAALGIMASTLVSLAAQHAPANARIYLLDFTPVDDPNAGYLAKLADQLPYDIQ